MHRKNRVCLVEQDTIPGDANAQQGVCGLEIGDHFAVLDAIAKTGNGEIILQGVFLHKVT